MRVILAILLGALAAIGAAQELPNLVENGDFADGMRGWGVRQDAQCNATVVEGEVGDFDRYVRLELKPPEGQDAWAIQLMRNVEGFIEEGDRLELRFWARSREACQVHAFLQIPVDPWEKPLARQFTLTPEWQEYTVEGQSDAAYSPGGLVVGFHLGFDTGTIELAGVRAHDLDLAAQGERPTLDKPQSLITNGDFAGELEGNWTIIGEDRATLEVVDAEVGEYAKAARLTLAPEADQPPWNIQFGQGCDGYIRPGDAVYFRAWLRSPEGCRVRFIWELGEPPHSKFIDQQATLTGEWQEYRFMGRAGRGFRPGESQAKLFLGYDAGVVEVAGVRVENCGNAPDSAFDQTIDFWAGREHPDDWREPALARIEEIRKGDLTVTVLGADGEPVPNAKVRVEQQRHHFRFGTALPAGRLLDTENPDNVRFQQEVERLFNTATFENDLKYGNARDGQLEVVDKAIEWLEERDIDARGHCLLWGSYQHLAAPVRELRGEELLNACREHVAEYAGHTRGKLYLWDVVNEAGNNTEVWDEVGWEAFADSFRWAREANPEVDLCYNDFGIVQLSPAHREKVRKRIEYLLEREVPLDALGLQAHMHTPLTPIHTVLEILDEWAEFGKDLEVTEYDLGCWDDEVHAEYTRDFMTALFSHPKTTAFIQWGFWEGSHWRSKVGGHMFRRDWSKRPAQDAYENLVFDEWWTDEQVETDDEGAATARAFYGRHEVTVEADGKTATVTVELTPEGGGEVEVRLD